MAPMITVTSQTTTAPTAPSAATEKPSDGNKKPGTARARTKPSHQRMVLTRRRPSYSSDCATGALCAAMGLLLMHSSPQLLLIDGAVDTVTCRSTCQG